MKMQKILLVIILVTAMGLHGKSQVISRIKISSITPNEVTGQDYSSWLNDSLTTLIPNCWNSSNFKYIDITLKLSTKTSISYLSLYDYEGVFTSNPASIFAAYGTQIIFIGTFTGEQYKTFIKLTPLNTVVADAIIVRKYGNNFPQKIQVYGTDYSENNTPPAADSLPKSVITFNDIAAVNVGDSAFTLQATSSNNFSPITYVSNNPQIISVALNNGQWSASILNTGTAVITASQTGNNNFTAALPVSTNILVNNVDNNATTSGKIPIDSKRWFQLTNASTNLQGLFDGKTDTEVRTGWGKILNNYDSYYPVAADEQVNILSIKMFDGTGSTLTQPLTISVITEDGQKTAIATFYGSQYKTWVGPNNNPNQFNLAAPLKKIKYIVLNSWNFFPTEIEFYGNYIAGAPLTPTIKKAYPLKNYFGANGFEWDFEAPNNSTQIDARYFKAAKTFTGFRHYMDWDKLESSEGNYTYNPTFNGGWNYDALYDSCKAAGIEVLACLKNTPEWMFNAYPADQQDKDNVPVKFGKDFTDPLSYIEQAKAAFQYAARYGRNTNVDRSLLTVNKVVRWTGDITNTIKVGLNTIHYIECDNERDKWWKGRKAYQTAFEYAANLSAFYDGNKNTMGIGAGIKNADSTMIVVMMGTALPTTDYLKGMVDWCRRNRGLNADGTVNLCWDVINYHLYSNDAKSSQGGNATRGTAPEVSGAAEVAQDFIEAAHQYAGDMPVWVTELGYDIDQRSPYKAIAIGDKSILQTQADWVLRSSLLYARSGIEKVFFYEMYDDNFTGGQPFGSCGLINADKTRKPSGDYIYQANKLIGNYIYQSTINNDPLVDIYKLNNQVAYVITVPDEIGRTAAYTLDLDSATYAKIYTPQTGSDTMTMQLVPTINGKLTIMASETPQFILAADGTGSRIKTPLVTITNFAGDSLKQFDKIIKIYPNPTSDFINVSINTNNKNNVEILISEVATGKVFKKLQFCKVAGSITRSIDIHTLKTGYYSIEVKQGDIKMVNKFLKGN